jgi:phage shock protein PspC (stress-responsive transcriptional regulator)
MKVTISVNLGGLAFVVDEDAYARLQAYLEEISSYFRTLGDGGEVVADIESRLAEQLQARLAEGKREVVSLADVEAMVKAMGTVADISGESVAGDSSGKSAGAAAAPAEQPARQRPRRLYRDLDDVVIAGVCSGIAAHFGIDPLLVRLAFIASVFFGGVGVIVYLLLWLLVPPAVTATEKVEMRGETVTLENWQVRLKDRAEKVGVNHSRLADVLQRVGQGLDRVIRFIGLVIGRFGALLAALIGFFMMLGGALAVAGLVFVAFTLIGPQSNYYFDFPLRAIVPAWLFWTLILSTAWLALVPLLMLVQTGATLVRRKSAFRLLPTVALLGTWLMAGAVLASSVLQTVPAYQVKANEVVKVENLPSVTVTEPFHGVHADRIQRIVIERGPEAKAVLRGPDNALEQFQLNVRDGLLILDNVKSQKPCLFCLPRHGLAELVVTVPALDDVNVGFAREVVIKGFEGEKLKIVGTSLDSLTMSDMKIDELDLKTDNVDVVTLSGKGANAVISMMSNGPATLHAFDYPLTKLSLSLHGEIAAEVKVSRTLEVKSDRRGRVDLRGKATVTELSLPIDDGAGATNIIINGEEHTPVTLEPVTDAAAGSTEYQVGTVKIRAKARPGSFELTGVGGESDGSTGDIKTMTVTSAESVPATTAAPVVSVVHRVE